MPHRQEDSRPNKPRADLLKRVEAYGLEAELFSMPPLEETAARLASEAFAGFEGAQVRITNPVEGYLYQGEIKRVRLVGEGDRRELLMEFGWCAAMDEGRRTWHLEPLRPYRALLGIFVVQEQSERRLVLHSPVTNELVNFSTEPNSFIARPAH